MIYSLRLAATAAVVSLSLCVALGDATLNLNGFGPQTVTAMGGGNTYTNTSMAITYIDPVTAADNPLSANGKLFTAYQAALLKQMGANWTIAAMPSLDPSNIFKVTDYTPTITGGGVGRLKFIMSYTQGNAGNIGPPPIVDPKKKDLSKGTWTQALITNAPKGGNVSPYLDIKPPDADTYGAPWYPHQYVGSPFGDWNRRTVTLLNTPIDWQGVAFLSTLDSTVANRIDLYGGVSWGMTLTAKANPAPEPSTYAAFAVGGIGLFVRRRRSRRSL